MVSELKQKQQRIKEKKVLNRDEICHGTLEDILLGKFDFCSLSLQDASL